MSRFDRYTCEEVFRRLDDFVDRELAPEEHTLVEDHLKTCAACLAEYRFERSVIDAIRRKVDVLQPPPGLKDDIMRVLREG